VSESGLELYAGREQTLVKHVILEGYLERFAHIVGTFWDTITYVDCFSGPWNVQSDNLEDSSFGIALNQLRKAQSDLADNDRSLSLRCFFLERNSEAYRQLKQFADDTTDAVIETRNASLEESISDIADFVKRGGLSAFPFIFVDPTGWTGFAMDLIAPLLQCKPSEVLINFMTGHIIRFAESSDPKINTSFDQLFGSIDYRSRIGNLSGQDREDELVRCYMDAVRETGDFDHVCSALVLHPEKDRTHFHLIYATRNLKGVDVFKKAEKTAMAAMEKARAEAQQRKRVIKTGQQELFASDHLHNPTHYDALRERFLGIGKSCILDLIKSRDRVLFDDVWAIALSHPLVWDSDVKKWIKGWTKKGIIKIEGMTARDRVPKRGKHHWLVWVGEEVDQ